MNPTDSFQRTLAFAFTLLISTTFAQTWQSVGSGTNNSSHGMLVWNNQLINVGSFNNPCNRVASWNGSSWSCLGSGVGLVGRAAAVWQGKLVVVGDFWNVQQPCVGCNGVAVWDGVSWTPLGNGVNNDVLCVTVWNNELVIAGDFTQANGIPVSRIAKWNGTAWQSIGQIGDFGNDIRAMVEWNGELYVGGDFNNVGGNPPNDGLVKWNAATSSWAGGNSGVDLIGGVNESVRVLYVNPNDNMLYMGGEFPELHDGDAPAPDYNMSGVAKYDGSNWTPLSTGLNDYVRAIHEYNGQLVCGGYFTTAGGVSANKIAKWNPATSTWSAMGLGFNGVGIDEYVKSAAVYNGTFYAGGAYTIAEGNSMNYIARWYEPPTAAPVAWMNTSSTSICGSGCIDFFDNSTNAPTSWNWSFPGSTIPTSTLQNPGNICYNTQGTYVATLQACNSFGCNSQNMTITVASAPSLTVNNASICNGASATLTATPAISGGSYLWSPGGQTTQSIIVNPSANTAYNVSYTLFGCTSNPQTSTVTVGSTPTVTASGSVTICQGQSAVLTATPSSAGGTYQWSPSMETTATINASPSTTTEYTVTYTLNGCASSASAVYVTVQPEPTATVNNSNICEGETANLTCTPATSGGTYLWSPGGETTSTISVSPASSTSYSVIYTLNGCESSPQTSSVTVNPIPAVSVNNVTVCPGETGTITATPSQSGGTYLWSPGSETTPSINVSPTSSSSYSIVYTLNGCESSPQTSSVTVNPSPIVSVNNLTLCQGETGTITATPSQTGGTYLWSPGNETTPSINVSPSSSTSYSLVYALNGCESSPVSSSVTINPIPLNSTTTSGSVISSDLVGAAYQWIDCNQNNTAIPSETGQSYAALTNGSYAVIVTMNGCTDTSACQLITGLGLIEDITNITFVYPNPVERFFTLANGNYESGTTYAIYDVLGRTIQHGILTNDMKIDARELSRGRYVLVVHAVQNDRYFFDKN